MFLKSLRRNIYRWLRTADLEGCIAVSENTYQKRNPSSKANRPVSIHEEEPLDSDGMNFKVINGRGGVAIEIRTRDSKTGEYTLALYVIPEEHDLAQELAKIITMQALRY